MSIRSGHSGRRAAAVAVLVVLVGLGAAQRASAAWSPAREMAGEVQTSHSAIDADGDSITIWERFVGNGQSSIEFRRRSAAGALGPVGVLADRATSNGVSRSPTTATRC